MLVLLATDLTLVLLEEGRVGSPGSLPQPSQELQMRAEVGTGQVLSLHVSESGGQISLSHTPGLGDAESGTLVLSIERPSHLPIGSRISGRGGGKPEQWARVRKSEGGHFSPMLTTLPLSLAPIPPRERI